MFQLSGFYCSFVQEPKTTKRENQGPLGDLEAAKLRNHIQSLSIFWACIDFVHKTHKTLGPKPLTAKPET